MNLRPGNLPRFLVCHSRSCGFLDFWPTIGFFTTASLKWSTTAATAKTPPSRSYRLFSGMVCWACAYAVSAPAKIASGVAVSASPAAALRLVIEVETDCAATQSRLRRLHGNLLRDGHQAVSCILRFDPAERQRFPKINWRR